ncbi:MAG: DUF4388 domain-containing protein [Planctomycetota bacterium]
MHSQDPQSELRALFALVDAVRLRVQTEMETMARSGIATPLLRSCLTRARGHLELAHRALSESRPESSFAPQRGLPTSGLQPPLRLGIDVTGAAPLDAAAGYARQPGEPLAGHLAPGQARDGERRAHGRHVFRPNGDQGAASWVQSRVEEIGRALESALGGDDDDPFSSTTKQKRAAAPHHDDNEVRDVEIGAACPAPQAPPHFTGTTDVLSIPDLIGFFQVQSKTGVLEIEHKSENFRLEFEKGSLLHAASSKSPRGERLGEILVRRGAITEAHLAAFLSNLQRGERLGSALLRLEGISEADLAAAIEAQVLGIFVRLAKLPGCTFTFREGAVDGALAGRVRHNVTRLLLDSARQLDEAEDQRASA